MPRILVLEDDPEFSALLSDSLQRVGHDATMCSTVEQAVSAFTSDPFDVVVADLIIKRDGEHTAEGGLLLIWRVRELTADARTRVPIIAISGTVHHLGMQHALDTARHMGADEVLAKPFSPHELMASIDRVIAERLSE